MIYFIRSGRDGPVKIGYSGDVIRRIVELQEGNPRGLHLLGVIENVGEKEEKEVHDMFAGLRVRGEWYYPVKELLDFILTACFRGGLDDS